jgi:hypothetical protein
VSDDDVPRGVLWYKIDALQKTVEKHTRLDREDRKELEERVRKTEAAIAVIDQRLTHTRGIFGVLQLSMMAVMTWLGVNR